MKHRLLLLLLLLVAADKPDKNDVDPDAYRAAMEKLAAKGKPTSAPTVSKSEYPKMPQGYVLLYPKFDTLKAPAKARRYVEAMEGKRVEDVRILEKQLDDLIRERRAENRKEIESTKKQISDIKRGIAKVSAVTLSSDLKTGEIGVWPMGTRATIVDRVIDGNSMIVHAKNPDNRLRVRPNSPGSGPLITDSGSAFKYQAPFQTPLDGKPLLVKGMTTKDIADDSEVELPGIWEVDGIEEAAGQKLVVIRPSDVSKWLDAQTP